MFELIRSGLDELKFIINILIGRNRYANYLGKYTYYKLKRAERRVAGNASVFGAQVKFPDSYWFLYSIKELFIDEVYKFSSSSKTPYIIDCGSNIGLSIYYFKSRYPDSTVVGFEPDEKLYMLALENLTSLKALNGVQLINKAVWKYEGEISFHPEGTLGGSIVDKVRPSKAIVTVPCVKLEKYLDRKVDFLKLDIEGAELEVLKSCTGLLDNVENMFVEYHCLKTEKQELHDLLQIIVEANFRYYIKESYVNLVHPMVEKIPSNTDFDVLLNIFCYRIEK